MAQINEDEKNTVTLKVDKSSVDSFDSGIARIHSSHMDAFEQGEIEMIELRCSIPVLPHLKGHHPLSP